MSSSASDIESILADAFENAKRAGQFDPELDAFMVNEVVPVWKGYYPVDTGEGRDSIQVTKQAQGGNGKVSATDDAASYIEYGTEDTPEFAPRAKTIEHFRRPSS